MDSQETDTVLILLFCFAFLNKVFKVKLLTRMSHIYGTFSVLCLCTLILFLFTFGNHCDSVYTSPWSLEINLGANVISKF